MVSPAQIKAVKNHRKRLKGRGIHRFEVQGRASDKELLRALAKRLADGGAEASRIRQALVGAVANGNETKGRVWEALRRSPLVGANLAFERVAIEPRDVEL